MTDYPTHTPLPAIILMLSFLAAVLVSSYGWGAWILGRAGLGQEKKAVTAVAGLGVMTFLAGILNLLRIAYGPLLDGLLVIGLVLALRPAGRWRKKLKDVGEWMRLASLGGVMMMIMGVAASIQTAPSVFNFHDDFEKYFAHPVRMLQTGTVFGSPLSAMGSETLGGQAFLHALVLNHFPITYINGMDALMGLLLCLLLCIVGISKTRKLIVSLIGAGMIFIVNPQYVNTSALYLAIAFLLAAFICCATKKPNEDFPPPMLLGLIYAAIVSFKTYYVFFPPFHLCVFATALIVLGKPCSKVLRWLAMTSVFTLSFVAPWILVHLPNYLQATPNISSSSMSHIRWIPPFFSWRFLNTGNSFGHYSSVALIVIFWGVFTVVTMSRQTDRIETTPLAGFIAAALSSVGLYAMMVFFGPLLNGYASNLRYAIPFLIAGAPFVFKGCIMFLPQSKTRGDRSVYIGLLLLGLLIPAIFLANFSHRLMQGWRIGTVLALSDLASNKNYIKYNEYVLKGAARLRVGKVQNMVPQGASMVVWISTPFYLNYKRNVIYDADPAGIASPWASIPASNYFLIEYKGAAVRSVEEYMYYMQNEDANRERHIARSCMMFLNQIDTLKKNAQVIYDDGGIILFQTRKSET